MVTWNISNYGGGTEDATDIQNAFYGVVPSPLALAGQRMAPDIIGVQEVGSATALADLRNLLNSASGSPGDWVAAPFVNGPDTESVLLYRSSRFTLVAGPVIISAGASASAPIPPRNTYRYDLRPVGYASPAATVGIYVTHMKAQESGGADEQQRLLEAQRIRDNAEGLDTNPSNGATGDGLPGGYNFVLMGDFNIQSSADAEYAELVGSQANNAGRFFDPINTAGNWNNNSSFRFVHTQDPVGGGGMDDRFDQIIVSQSLEDTSGWHYIGSSTLAYSTSTWNDPNHSYRCWGNDGSTFNAAIATTTNTMVGASIAQSLINASDSSGHLPVFADFRVPALAGVNVVSLNFGSVRQGSLAPTRTLTVSNTGNTALFGANGIATLNYSLGAASGFMIPAGSFSDAAGGAGVNHTLSMPTSVIGPKSATLVITTDSPEQPTLTVQLTGEVLPPNTAPIANAGLDQTLTDSDNSGAELVTLDGAGSDDPDGTIASYVWRIGSTTILTGVSGSVSLPVGVSTITLTVTDNEGATGTDTVLVTINAPSGPICDSLDFNNDGIENDPTDIEAFLSVYSGGACVPAGNTCNDIDFNNDGIENDPTDIESFLSVYSGGPCL